MESGEIVRFNVEYERVGASETMNVFHCQYQGGTQDDSEWMEELATRLFGTDSPYDLYWQAVASAEVDVVRLTAAVMNLDGTVLRNLDSVPIEISGGVLFDNMAAATSGQILFDTIIPGIRGMKYIPGLADPRVNFGLLDSTAVTAMINLGFALLEVLDGSFPVSAKLGVLSRALEAFVPFITSVASDSNPIYQRRRGPGRGS